MAAVACGGCGGGSKAEAPPIEQAQGFADDFTQKLVGGRWALIEADVSPTLTRPLRDFQATIRRDGVRQVRLPGRLAHDCPPSPSVSAGRDCFVYRLSGQHVVPVQGATSIDARYRLWLDYVDGRWQAVNYSYDVILGTRS